MPLGVTNDAVAWVYAVMRAYGAQMIDKDGNITVKSDATKQVLEWFKKLVPVLPPRRLRLGRRLEQQGPDLGTVVADLQPALGLGGGGARRAEGGRAALDLPDAKGPEGPFRRRRCRSSGASGASQRTCRRPRACLTHLCQRSSVEQTVAASKGYDIPPFAKLHDFKTWAEEGPPKGSIYNYPPRGDVQVVIPYSESPTKIANQIYAQATVTKMIAQCTQQGKTIQQAMDWAAGELEGFSRS